MAYHKKVLLLVFLWLALSGTTGFDKAAADDQYDAKINEASLVLSEIIRIPEKGIPPALFRRAYGVAVIPQLIKGGFILGGKHGKGILSVKSDNGEWTNPTFITLTGGGIGLQIGVQSTDIILIFMRKKSYEYFLKGKFTLGADASVAAGPVGRYTGAATDVRLRAEIYSYSRSRGLFAGVSIDGSGLEIDYRANGVYYKQPVTVAEIFSGKVKGHRSAEMFRELLKDYSK
ncbi:lipid-binding SYLF domain-containing protein [Thermodesulfobacteriota bacterium]